MVVDIEEVFRFWFRLVDCVVSRLRFAEVLDEF